MKRLIIAVIAVLLTCAASADVLTAVANGADQQFSITATATTGAWSLQAISRVGDATGTPGDPYVYVIPFQLPALTGGSIGTVSLNAYIESTASFSANMTYIDVVAVRVSDSPTVQTNDAFMTGGTVIGDNVQLANKTVTNVPAAVSYPLQASYFQSIYDNDPSAAGKYVILLLRTDGVDPYPSNSYLTYTTQDGVTEANRPVLQIVTGTVAPTANFNVSPVSGWAPLNVAFTDTSTGTITNRFWDFGDGTTTNTTLESFVHTYASAGTYSVALTVSGPVGSDTSTKADLITAVAPEPPVASFSAVPTSGRSPMTVTFTDTSTGMITNRYWDFGDGSTTNVAAASIAHIYTSTGTFSVAMTVSGLAGIDTQTKSDLIAVGAPLPAGTLKVLANAADTVLRGTSASDAVITWTGSPTARTGGEALPIVNRYVIPFQLPDLAGRAITDVELNAFLISSYLYGDLNVFVDVYAGRVDTNSTVLATDWDLSVKVGENLAEISKFETVGATKSLMLDAAYFQDIYANDPDAAGKYVFLVISPESGLANSSAYNTWATADEPVSAKRPLLNIFTEAGGGIVDPPAPFHVTSGRLGADTYVLNWTTETGYLYSVWYSTNLLSGFLPLATDLPDSVTRLTNTTSVSPVFYKIEAHW